MIPHLRRTTLFVVALASAALTMPVALEAQNPMVPRLGIGYVANAPHEMVGGTVWARLPGLGAWGLYVDAKFDPSNRAGDEFFVEGLTPAEIAVQYPNDEEVDEEEEWMSFNGAILRAVTPELILYAGAGYSTRENYRRYLDVTTQRGQFGFYWVEDDTLSGNDVNVMGGALIRISGKLLLQFGGELAPKGFTVGASIAP
jgi:hypothetical protein